jgi:hypothetical protein
VSTAIKPILYVVNEIGFTVYAPHGIPGAASTTSREYVVSAICTIARHTTCSGTEVAAARSGARLLATDGEHDAGEEVDEHNKSNQMPFHF